MLRIVTEPMRTARRDLEMATHKVATFAKTHPGQWRQTDELPCNYAGRISSGTAREFQPDSERRVPQKGGLSHVKYAGPNGDFP